jgi:hypothetical protein
MKFRVFWDVAPCSHVEVDDVSEVSNTSIIRSLMMEAVRTSETSVILNVTTRRLIPEDSKLVRVYLSHAYYMPCPSHAP